MLRPEIGTRAVASTHAAEFERIGLPIASPRGAGFSALMNDVASEVREFIEHGSPASASLSVSGQAVRLRTLPADATPWSPAVAGSAPSLVGNGAKQQAFLAAIAPWVNDAAGRLGVAPEIVAAQAALESGWGERPLRHANGDDTHNLFGIKAGAAWQGRVAAAATTEVEDGVEVRRSEPFRSYPDYASAFRDFTRLLLDNPRYRGALNAGDDAVAYAQGLARGGYATDPAYADKLARLAGQLQGRD